MSVNLEKIKEIRQMTEALKEWMDSVVEQRKDYPMPSVELNARDALQCTFRVAANVYHLGELISDILDPPNKQKPECQ